MSPVHLLFGFFIGCSQLSMDLNLVENSEANKLIMIASFFAIFGFRSEGSEHTKYGINRVDEMNNDKKKIELMNGITATILNWLTIEYYSRPDKEFDVDSFSLLESTYIVLS